MAMKSGDDPKDFKVQEVNDYLAQADDHERNRVLEAEVAGKNRSTIVGGDGPDEEAQAEAALADVRGVEEGAEGDGDAGPMGATIANQQPVAVTGLDLAGRMPVGATMTVTPTHPTDGGDGTRAAAATKTTDNIWTPFKPPAWTYAGNTVAGSQVMASSGQTNAVIAANALTKF